MKRMIVLAGGAVLALGSALALAQDSPESLLPPGFDKPAPKRNAPPPATRPGIPAPDATSSPVVQPIPGESAVAPPAIAGKKLPTLKEIEAMSADELDELLGLKPKFDVPPAARRSLKRVGVLAADEGGVPAGSFTNQDADLVRAALEGNKGQLVSRWGHILLRRALASRLDAPQAMNPADFAALRAALLVRMGEGEAARALVQDVDVGNYTPALTAAALDAYAFTADITGVCPVIAVQGGVRKDPDWQVLRAVCQAFQGNGAAAMAQLDRFEGGKVWPKVDMLLAQKYAGAAGSARRAVKIEWDGVSDMSPWRYAFTIGVGLEPPAELLRNADPRYRLAAATAPMLPLTMRAEAADLAAGIGILSSAAMVDLYGQVRAQEDITGDWQTRAETLRRAYVGDTPADRLAAMRELWDETDEPQVRYGRQVLTAYAAARMPIAEQFAKDAPDLIAAMLAAGLDANAVRWIAQTKSGSLGWALLVTGVADRPSAIGSSQLEAFYDSDPSSGYRKSRFLLAGLAGLGRIDAATAGDFAAKLELDLGRQTRWTRLIDAAAERNNPGLVALLAGLGMQGNGWDKMTTAHLYHIVSALNRVGLGAEARMIAAEAVARG